MPKTLSDYDPSRGLLKLGLRLPIMLYRLHLGWMLGTRFLMLTHYGRKTGLPHQTVVEVVDYDRQSGACVIASGWGKKSDWYRNIMKTPQVFVEISRKKFHGLAHQLPPAEAESALLVYARKHPAAFKELYRLMSDFKGENLEENCHHLAQNIPIILLTPVPPTTPEQLPTQ
jgi:deazaflavin-dependent oxidoreductase (nitroreductase family)